MNARQCIRCSNIIDPIGKATHDVETEAEGQDVIGHLHGFCGYDCLLLHSLHKVYVGGAWWQKRQPLEVVK